MSTIYKVVGFDCFVALTNPASVRQIVTALKGEGLIKRNARFTSYVYQVLKFKQGEGLELINITTKGLGERYVLEPTE